MLGERGAKMVWNDTNPAGASLAHAFYVEGPHVVAVPFTEVCGIQP
jgi:hypothetical protein